MNTGLTLQEMAAELQRRENSKRDFIVDTRSLEVFPNNGGFVAAIGENGGSKGSFPVTRHALRQMESRLQVPAPFADRLAEKHPDMLAYTLNQLFQREPERRMVRTLDGKARAFLSDRYRLLDNFDLAQAVLPLLLAQPDARVVSTQFTDTRFYIKALFPRVEREVSVGDPVQSGVVISNSEVGSGSLSVQPLVYRLVCKNGMISSYGGQRKYHVGRAHSSEAEAFELYRDETLQADDRAFWLKVQDVVRATMDESKFEVIVQKMAETKGQPITGNPLRAVEEVAKVMNFNQTESDGILQHLIRGGDLSRYGLLNAITRSAQDVEDYDRATELEAAGGRIIELPKSDWEVIAQAA
jgi:hypothetical protein